MSNEAKPRVSVIIPLYNKERTILRTLESLVAQTFAEWECVVIDDGSKDRSPDLVTSFADPRVRLIRQANAGPGAARNRGAAEAKSDILCFLDADDQYDPDYLAFQVATLDRFPDVAASVTGHRRTGLAFDGVAHFSGLGVSEGLWTLPPDLAPEAGKAAVDFMHSGSIAVRREIFLREGGYYQRNRSTYGEDTWIWLRLAAAYPLHRDLKPRNTYHVEDSELGMGRRTPPPPWPMLIDSTFCQDFWPRETRACVQRILAYYAMIAGIRAFSGDRRREGFTLVFTHLKMFWLPSAGARKVRAELKRQMWRSLGRLLRPRPSAKPHG